MNKDTSMLSNQQFDDLLNKHIASSVKTQCLRQSLECMQALVQYLPQLGFQVDTNMYRALIIGCKTAGMPEDAHRILLEMEEEGYQV